MRRAVTLLSRTFNFSGISDTIIERSDFPLSRCKDVLGESTIAIIGYGPQGRSQALNLRDNGFNVIVGARENRNGGSWDQAVADDWTLGTSLFTIEDALARGKQIYFLVSDAAQSEIWPAVAPHLTSGKTLCFAHGFGIVYSDQTQIKPPSDIDVIMVAPKGAGVALRNAFCDGRGIRSSIAVHQDASGAARESALAGAFAIGSSLVFETTFRNEVVTDLTGERCTLVGMLQGAFLAQYEVLREKGHSPVEAYNETIDEALRCLYPIVAERGMDTLLRAASVTAQRGALDWAPRFRDAIKPVVEECYDAVASGAEVRTFVGYFCTAQCHAPTHPPCNARHRMWQGPVVSRATGGGTGGGVESGDVACGTRGARLGQLHPAPMNDAMQTPRGDGGGHTRQQCAQWCATVCVDERIFVHTQHTQGLWRGRWSRAQQRKRKRLRRG